DGSELNTQQTFDFGSREFGTSYIGRVAYNYREKYLFYSSYRRDGTNKFSEKWGNFFTVGGGWVVSEESFFDIAGVNFLKLRAGWGQVGNDGIAPAIGQTTFEQTSLVIGDQLVTGVRPDNIFDLIDTWETTEEINIGLSARFLNNRLSFEADLYQRDTENAVLPVEQPGTGEFPRRNAGSIRNEGLEIALGWNDNINSNLSYSVAANVSFLDNEVLSVGDQPFLNGGSAEFRQISEPGSSLNEFFGFEVNGVFQTNEQIQNSGYTEDFINSNNLVPGDLFFRDQNDDGVINADDRVYLGSFIPSYTFGLNLGLTYKNLSFSTYIQGQGGNTILNRKRGEIIFTQDTNIDADLANNFWTEAGSTNEYPSAAGYRKPYNNGQLSEFLLEDGDYWRVQNVRVAYNFVNKNLLGVNLPNTTISFTAERPLTVFDYNGFNPEVANGVDRQTYPVPAVYTLGLNVRL
ncbi:MAG: TonB-dependent receptor, partial [Bacteroidota bacterium]